MRASIFISFLLFVNLAFGQRSKPDTTYFDSIRNMEYQLEGLSYNIINSEDENERITSCFYFIQTLKKALKVPGSYDYDFNGLRTVSVLRPDDNQFRIFTWNLLLDSGVYRYFGAIQMNNRDSLVLYGLYDSSDHNRDIYYAQFDNRHWMGALYYQVHHYRWKKEDHYILFGWDGQDARTNRKIIEVLSFDEDQKPVFGKEIFSVEGDVQSRMIFDFSNNTAMLCRYEEQEDKIVFANLIPINPLFEGRYETYVPDGTYDYLEFKKGYWYRYPFLFEDRKENSFELRNE